MTETPKDDPFKDYKKHPNGDIQAWPIWGWDGFFAEGDTCAFRMLAITSPQQREDKSYESVQFALTPHQCRAFAEFLQKMADKADENPVQDKA